MKILTLALLALPLFLISTNANAQTIGLSKGGNVPSAITLLDQENNKTDLNDLSGDNGTVIVFYRSAKWCPYCQSQLIDLKANQEAIESKGYNLVGISYDSVADLKKFSDKHQISYSLLSDEGSQTIKAFGIFNDKHKEGSFAYGVPHPAVYIVGKDGVIKDVLREEGYKKRPEVSDIVEAIEK
ncbi:MAG: peroxiredoxin family protein [Pseudomonadota bacterium]